MGDGVQCPTPSVDVPPLSPNLPQAKEKIILAIDEKKDPSLAVSSLVSKLRHIKREDVARLVEDWQGNSIDDTRPPQSTYDTSIGHKTIDGTKKIISAIEERKSSKHNIQLPTEEANCVKIRKMFSDVITDCLRRYFIEQWNLLYPGRTWMSDTISGESIVKKLSDAIIHNKDNGDMIRALKSGNEKQWDSATLLFVLLDSNLELIEDQSNTAVNASKDIEHLRYIESLFSARMSCPSDEYKDIVAQIKQMNILGENAVQEIDDIDNSPMERKMNIKRRQLEDKEKSRKIMGSRAADSLKEYQPKLEVSTEAANFIVVRDLLQKIIPKHLSIHFIKQWNDKYPDQIWQSNNSSGQDLLDKLSDVIKNTMSLEVKRALEAGSEQQWDLSTVLFVLQNSDFNLVKHYGKRGQKAKTSSSISRTEIDDLLCIEKKFFSAHTRNQSCPSEKFSDIVRKVKEFASNFLSEHAQTAICEEVEELLKQNAMVKHDDDDKQSKEEVVKHDDDDKQSKEEDVTISANLSAEQENFVKIARIVLDLFPKYLRKVFKRQWDKKYPEEEWCSGKESEVLYSKLKENVKNNRGRKAEIERLKNGNDQTWDTTTLVFAILETGLGLVDPVRPLDEWSSPLRISEEIFTLRKIRNSVFGHVESMSCPSAKLLEMISNIKSSGKSIFNQEAMKEIDAIANSPIQTDAIGQLNQQWEIEKIRNEKLEQYLADIYRRVGNLEDDVEALKRDVRTIQSESEGQPIPKLDINKVNGNLKKKYKSPGYYMHQIHKIESGENIVKKDAHVNESAVQLTLSQDFKPEDTFKDENRRYFDQFIGVRRDSVELTKLLDDRQRITFVRGVAGMGKTVLSKQLVWGWANDKMYTNFKLCIMFECRDLNFFVRTEGANLNKREQLQKYIVETFGCDLEGVDGVLFVVDGLDELFDIYEKDSIIWQLLFRKLKYSGARIILTGRPHVESKLEDDRVGDIRKVEIQGFTEKQINDYIRKFTVSEDEIEFIDRAIASSIGYLPIIHIPQFLNTFCCVAILSGGVGVDSTAELYSWVLMLLLNEHAGKEDSGKKQTCKTFQIYSPGLKELAAVCYELLRDNKIIFEGDIKSKFGKSEDCLKFCESLFVDVSDKYVIKYQFKHLTLIEFLAALHICITENRMKIIEELLQKKYINAVVYTCELIARASCNPIIKNMLQSVTNVQNLDVKLTAIIELVEKCDLDEKIKFQRSLDILVSFLAKSRTEDECMLSSLSRLYCGPLFKSSMEDSNNLYKITLHLEECSADKLHAAFKNIKVGEFIVNNEWTVLGAKYLGTLDIINFKDMKINLNTARTKLGKIGDRKCTLVWIEDCELDEYEGECIDNGEWNSDLDELVLWDSKLSKLNKNSFIILCDWGTSSKKFILDQVKFEEEWWMTLVEAMERKHSIGKLDMKELIITRCTPSIEKEFQDRIVQSGIKLNIDDEVLYPTTPVPISPQVYLPQPTEIHSPEDTEEISSEQNSTNETHQERLLHPVTEISSSPQESVQEVCREQLSQSSSEVVIRMSTSTLETSMEKKPPGGAKVCRCRRCIVL